MIDLVQVITGAGYLGISLVIFAESGLFFGFFLPGDSLLFAAGLAASRDVFDIYALTALCAVCAIAGDSAGYAFGRKVGPKIFTRDDSFLFKKKYVEQTKQFYDKYGKKTIILARFVPIVRTFAPILAGVGEMKYSEFISYNIIGGLFWTVGILTAGYTLGQTVPGIDQYLLPIILAIIVVSVLPGVWEIWKGRKEK